MSIFKTKAPPKAEPDGQAYGVFNSVPKVQELTPPKHIDVKHVPNAPNSGGRK